MENFYNYINTMTLLSCFENQINNLRNFYYYKKKQKKFDIFHML